MRAVRCRPLPEQYGSIGAALEVITVLAADIMPLPFLSPDVPLIPLPPLMRLRFDFHIGMPTPYAICTFARLSSVFVRC